jgi:hypothetical protein
MVLGQWWYQKGTAAGNRTARATEIGGDNDSDRNRKGKNSLSSW